MTLIIVISERMKLPVTGEIALVDMPKTSPPDGPPDDEPEDELPPSDDPLEDRETVVVAVAGGVWGIVPPPPPLGGIMGGVVCLLQQETIASLVLIESLVIELPEIMFAVKTETFPKLPMVLLCPVLAL